VLLAHPRAGCSVVGQGPPLADCASTRGRPGPQRVALSSCFGCAQRGEPGPAIEAAGVDKPGRICDLRSTFASNALAAGVTVFELAKVMGTSVAMIERHHGTLIGGAYAGIARRLDVLKIELERAPLGTAEDMTPIGGQRSGSCCVGSLPVDRG